MEKLFTLDEVAAAAGLERSLVQGWVARRLIVPTVYGSKGTGNGHRFTETERNALRLAAAFYTSERGCRVEFVGEVYERFVESMREPVVLEIGGER